MPKVKKRNNVQQNILLLVCIDGVIKEIWLNQTLQRIYVCTWRIWLYFYFKQL